MNLEEVKARMTDLQNRCKAEKGAMASEYERGRVAGWVEALEYALILIKQIDEERTQQRDRI